MNQKTLHRLTATVGGLALLITTLSISVGCGEDPIVYHESVPIVRVLDEQVNEANLEENFRMIAGITLRSPDTWFFKLSGPVENVAKFESIWETFLLSVWFVGDEPNWDLPENWKTEGLQDRPMPGGSSMKIATLTTDDPEISVSVSNMPGQQSLGPNVNRWRGQLGLPNVSDMQVFMRLTDLKSHTLAFKIFDASGPKLTTRMGGAAPFANGSSRKGAMPGGHPAVESPNKPIDPHAGMPDSLVEEAANVPVDTSIHFEPPNDWKAGKTSSMVLGRWSKEGEHGPLELTMLTMKANDESWKMNLEAWSEQIKTDAPDIFEVTELMEVAGTEARKAHLIGQNSDPDKNLAIVAVMMKAPDESGYFLKLAGSETAVFNTLPELDSFLSSISFPIEKESTERDSNNEAKEDSPKDQPDKTDDQNDDGN